MKFMSIFLVAILAIGKSFAADIVINGQFQQPIHPSRHRNLQAQSSIPKKQVTLLKIQLSPKARQAILTRAKQAQQVSLKSIETPQVLPRKVQLGMNGIPVLEQGNHGSCVTFANTAAVDAVLNRGDYISQLCQLQLGRYLEKLSYAPSGWEGSWGSIVLNQMDVFGIVNKNQQRQYGCGGLKEYPTFGDEPNTEITLDEYHQLSEGLQTPDNRYSWTSILDNMESAFKEKNMNKVVLAVKRALREEDRVTFGVFIPDFDLGLAGAVGTHRKPFDTWVLTPLIYDDLVNGAEIAGHEMIITGYDDNAVTVDEEGQKYRGLFTLRNSWGSDVGDDGNFYMTYKYFKTLVAEAQRIRDFNVSRRDEA